MRAFLSRCVIARAMRGPDSREEGSIWGPKTQRADTARIFPVALSYVASSLAEPQRMPDSVSLCSFAEQCYLARCVAPRDLGLLKPCSYSFLTQGNITCENILRARICTAVRTGTKRGTHTSLVLCT